MNVFQVDVFEDELVLGFGIASHGAEIMLRHLEHVLRPLLAKARAPGQEYDSRQNC